MARRPLRPIRVGAYLVGPGVKIPKWANREQRRKFKKVRKATARAARAAGTGPWYVRSGIRNTEQQKILYQRYLLGQGPLAAKPGTSPHERGEALDVGDKNNVNVGLGARNRWSLKRFGLVLPVATESWHVELGRPGRPWKWGQG